MATWTGVARRTTVVFTVLIAVATFVAGTGQAAAGAPPVRTQASTNVVFVHGIDALSAIQFRPPHQDCAADWATMRSEIRTPAPFRSLTFGYYGANTNCDYNVPGNLDTSLNDIARQFSKFISTTFPNQRVDVVAHSMGGLIVRRAISGSQHHEAGFAYPLYIEDVVTLSTPHLGAALGSLCGFAVQKLQCKQISRGSDFLNALESNAQNPQSAFGTDWTLLGSEGDEFVTPGSATGMTAGHKHIYLAANPIDPLCNVPYLWYCRYPVPNHSSMKYQQTREPVYGGGTYISGIAGTVSRWDWNTTTPRWYQLDTWFDPVVSTSLGIENAFYA